MTIQDWGSIGELVSAARPELDYKACAHQQKRAGGGNSPSLS